MIENHGQKPWLLPKKISKNHFPKARAAPHARHFGMPDATNAKFLLKSIGKYRKTYSIENPILYFPILLLYFSFCVFL